MNREEAKELLPIIQAFAEGKTIQERKLGTTDWIDTETPCFNSAWANLRIKPNPKYRPFKSQEECWNEMHKHPDFGWVKGKATGEYKQVIRVFNYNTELIFNIYHKNSADYSPEMMFSIYTFTDGTPFGIKEE